MAATAVVTAQTCFNARGETTATIDAAQNVTAYTYFDAQGLVSSVTDPTGMNTAANCAAVSPVTGGKRGVTSFGYDGAGNRLSRSTWKDDLSAQTSEYWTYDSAARPSTYTDQNLNVTSYAYQVTSGLLIERSTTTGSKADVGDPSGSSLQTTKELLFKSGSVDRVTSTKYGTDGVTAASSYQVGYIYDFAGRTKSVVEAPGTASAKATTYGYNTAGNITQVDYPDVKSAKYQWDLAGKVTQVVNPVSGSTLKYLYDPGRRLSTVQTLSGTTTANQAVFKYNVDGAPLTETISAAPTGSRVWTRDARTGVVTAYAQTDGATTNRSFLTYDANGRIVSGCKSTATACAGTDQTTTFGYDNAGQLQSAVVSNVTTDGQAQSWAYGYGNHGNRKTQTVVTKTSTGTASAATTYNWDNANQLTSSTGADAATYTYDKAGRRTKVARSAGATVTAGYDARGLATSVVTAGGGFGNGQAVTESRGFNALGQLAAQTVTQPGTAGLNINRTNYWDNTSRLGVTQIIDQAVATNGAAPVNQASYWGLDRIATIGAGGTQQYDYLGETLASTGVTAPTAYIPYGEPNPTPGTAYLYNGYRGEQTEGTLTHLRARDYDAKTGTFTTRDPLDGVNGTPGVGNPYHYADNDPLNQTDPTGMRPSDQSLSYRGGASPQVAHFTVPHKTGWGRVRIGFFIADCNVHPFPVPKDSGMFVVGSGDCREFSQQMDASNNRVYIEVDFGSGEGLLVSNPSCTNEHEDDCTSANSISGHYGTSVGGDDSVSINFAFGNSVALSALKISAELNVRPASDGRACVTGLRTPFPSLDAYYDRPGSIDTLLQEHESPAGPLMLASRQVALRSGESQTDGQHTS